jgi:endonuclease/exonuclease/phosphatase family metal-dependent hydrolase
MGVTHAALRRDILPKLGDLAGCQTTSELQAHPVYQALAPAIRATLETVDMGSFAQGPGRARDRYRIVAWNIERGTQFDGQLQVFRFHPYIRDFDVLLLTECDAGMARSGNRLVARDLARELGLHYAFAPCYLNLTKGSGIERHIAGENDLGLHGNAILSRYPLRNIQRIPLLNGIDKVASREKRLGSQTAIAADVEFPDWRLTVASVHLDAHSSQRHRRDQMQDVLDALPADGPAVLGGDWNTTTYDSSRALWSILGFWLRVLMGVDHVIRNHYLHPYDLFEKELFGLLEDRGFDYRKCNHLGEHTIRYEFGDRKTRQSLGEWVPAWCFPFIRWSLRHHGGRCPFKIDWFATRGVPCRNPEVIHDVREGREVPLSDHDAIGVDLAPAPTTASVPHKETDALPAYTPTAP